MFRPLCALLTLLCVPSIALAQPAPDAPQPPQQTPPPQTESQPSTPQPAEAQQTPQPAPAPQTEPPPAPLPQAPPPQTAAPAAPTICVPQTCESKHRACGLILDGCGEIVDCGPCPDAMPKKPAQGWHSSSDFIDTRINFTMTDENVLVRPGQTNPSVPGFRIDRPNQFGILFFDNWDTRYTGYENLTHIVLHKDVERGRLKAEAALVLRLLQFSDVNVSTLDDSSYIRVAYSFNDTHTKTLSLTAFPLSADRMRLGYSYRLSWGGSPIFFKFNPDLPASATPPVNSAPAPGARLQYTSDRFTVWAGFKTSVLLNKNPNVSDLQAIYGVLGGASVDPWKDHMRLEINGGYFDRGNNPNFYPTQMIGPGNNKHYPDFPVWTAGASVQVSIWNNLPPSLSLDYLLYRNDPTSVARYFAKPVYRPGFAWLLQAEATYLGTAVQDFEKTASTVVQWAYAGDVNFRAQYKHFRFKLDATMRSLEFMLLNQPSLVPYTSLPRGSNVVADKFISLGFDYFFEKAGITLGPTFGIDFPANITPPDAIPQLCGNTGGSLCTPATIVVRSEGDYSILPVGAKALPLEAVKLVTRADFLDYFAAILDVYYQHDPNQTHLTKAPDGTSIRDFNHPHALGFNLTLQARF